MNSILGMLSGGNMGPSILMQAIGAAMRGESPQAFMKKLANSDPRLKKMNLDDLYGEAQKLCQERGINQEEITKKLDDVIAPQIQNK